MSWLFILSVFPALKYYEIAYDREIKHQVQQGQVQFAKDISARNAKIDTRYFPLDGDKKVSARLKKRGVYTASYFQTAYDPNISTGAVVDIVYPPIARQASLNPKLYGLASDEYIFTLQFDSCGMARTLLRNLSIGGEEQLQFGPGEAWLFDLRYRARLDSFNRLQYHIDLRKQIALSAASADTLERMYPENRLRSKLLISVNGVQVDSILISPVREVTKRYPQSDPVITSEEYYYFDSLISIVRPRYNELVRRSYHISRHASADSAWKWQDQLEVRDNLDDPEKEFRRASLAFVKGNLRLASVLPSYDFPAFWDPEDPNASWFWVLFATIMLGTYITLDFAITRFFAENVLPNLPSDTVAIRKAVRNTRESVFLVVPPRIVETDYLYMLKEKVSNLPGSLPGDPKLVYYLNSKTDRERLKTLLSNTEEKLPPGLILEYFEENADDLDIWHEKLRMLTLLNRRGCQVMVISTVDSIKLHQQFIQLAQKAKKPREENEEGAGQPAIPEDYASFHSLELTWSMALSTFTQLYYPLEKWAIFSHAREARAYLKGKQCFLYLSEISLRNRVLHLVGVSLSREEGAIQIKNSKRQPTGI
ncbi:MAG: hypothetical protein AAF206_31605, partial [Bacteroidota bacterium]